MKIKVSTCILLLFLRAQIVWHTTKVKDYSIIKFTYQSQQRNLHNLRKIKGGFDEGYDSDGEPGPLCDMEYLEYTQYFDEVALPYVVTLDTGENYFNKEGN